MIYKRESQYHKRRRKHKQKAAQGWRKWFAWYRVKLNEITDNGTDVYAWLSFVERKFIIIEPWFDSNHKHHCKVVYYEYKRLNPT